MTEGAASPAAPRPDHRLPRARRVRRHNDFLRVERGGVRGEGQLVTLVARPGRGRLGFTVSKKVSLKATVRNLVKRRLREVLRTHPSWWRGLDLIVIARPECVGRTVPELDADVAAAVAVLGARLAAGNGREKQHGKETRPRRG